MVALTEITLSTAHVKPRGAFALFASFLFEMPEGGDVAALWSDSRTRGGGSFLRPTRSRAMEEELGLKLEPDMGPGEFLLIDGVEKLAGS